MTEESPHTHYGDGAGIEQQSPTVGSETRVLEDIEEELEDLRKRAAGGNNRLAIFVFIGTLLGSLLGVAADWNEASDLFTPLVKWLNPSPHVRIVGSSTILGEGIDMAAEWQEGYIENTQWEDDIPLLGTIERQVQMTTSPVGSVDGFGLAAEGKVDLLAASEPIPEAEIQKIAAQGHQIHCASVIGYDIITLVTDVNNDLQRAITVRELSSILTGGIKDWSEVGGPQVPIRILARPGSGTTDIVLNALTGSNEFRSHFIECDSNSRCLDLTLSTPGSLYWVSKAWLQTQPPRYLRPILIQRGAEAPTNPLSFEAGIGGQEREDFNPDNYPQELMRPLYMYVLRGDAIQPDSTEHARQFLGYVRSVEGQEILEKHHFYTHFDAPSGVQPVLPAGFGPTSDGPPVVCQ